MNSNISIEVNYSLHILGLGKLDHHLFISFNEIYLKLLTKSEISSYQNSTFYYNEMYLDIDKEEKILINTKTNEYYVEPLEDFGYHGWTMDGMELKSIRKTGFSKEIGGFVCEEYFVDVSIPNALEKTGTGNSKSIYYTFEFPELEALIDKKYFKHLFFYMPLNYPNLSDHKFCMREIMVSGNDQNNIGFQIESINTNYDNPIKMDFSEMKLLVE